MYGLSEEDRQIQARAREFADDLIPFEEEADAIEATAYLDGDQYVLNGVKWHVTSFNTADFAFFQARLAGGPHHGEHAMFLVDLPRPGVEVVRTPSLGSSRREVGLDGRDHLGVVGRGPGTESRRHRAVGSHQELLEVPLDVAGLAARRPARR